MALHDLDRLQAHLRSVADPVGFLANLFAYAPVGFAVWTPDGRPLLTNRAFMELFLVEPPPEYNVLEDDVLAKSGMLALFKRAFAGETVHVPTFWYDPRELNIITVREGRRVAMSMTIFPLFKSSGEIDFVAATYKDDTELMLTQERLRIEGEQLKQVLSQMERDIAERERMEEERTRLESQLRQSQKMEALGTLAGGIAHDFNNLLTVILGNTMLAREQLPTEHAVQRSLDETYKASLRATALIRQILAFGRPQEAKREVIQLVSVVEEALRLLRSALPAMIEIRPQFAAALPNVEADPTQVHQLIMNLGTNAAHAMGAGGGLLEVRLDSVLVSEELARTSAELREGRYLRLSVADNGCGIEKAILPRLFEPFFTTKPVGHGSGLGLSVVHGIMKSHQGAVTVYSQPGKGTTFHLYFPVHEGDATANEAVAEASLRGRGQHILLIDDEEAVSFLTTRILERLGYRVTSHGDPVLALQDFRSRPQEFDAVVTDHSMPGTSGTELAKRILALRPGVPVLMTSGYFRPEDLDAARAAGVHELILKPNTVDELGQVLHKVLAGLP